MHARDLMTPVPTSATPDDLICDAAAMMAKQDVGILPVVDSSDSDRLVGVLTDRDIVVRCTAKNHSAEKCRVSHHMTTERFATVSPSAELGEIARAMEEAKVRRVLVVDEQHRLVGIIGQADLTRSVGPRNPLLIEEVLENVLSPGATRQ